MAFPLMYTCLLEAPGQLFNCHKWYFTKYGRRSLLSAVMLHQVSCENEFLSSANIFSCFILLLKNIINSVRNTKKIRNTLYIYACTET